MEPTTDLDRLRAWLEGRLPPAQAERLERDLERDPRLAELLESLRDVYALTALEPEPPLARTTFETLERRIAAQRPAPSGWQRKAAAAVFALAAGTALAFFLVRELGGTSQESERIEPIAQPTPRAAAVELTAIALDEPAPSAYAPPLVAPEVLASYDPRGASGIQWLHDMDVAFAVARASQRPLLVFGSLPGCPWCAELRAKVFPEKPVLDLIDRYVPLEWDLGKLPPDALPSFMVKRGYPLFEVWTVDDEGVLNFSGRPDAPTLVEMMHQGLERANATGTVPEWDDVRGLGKRWLEAREARTAGRMAEAQSLLRDLARSDLGGPFAATSSAELSAIAADARSALLDAKAASDADPAGARANLETAADHFTGTDFEPDLRAVLAAWKAGNEFPELVQARRG
jgi:anti-sigma factor RsiW